MPAFLDFLRAVENCMIVNDLVALMQLTQEACKKLLANQVMEAFDFTVTGE